MGCATFDSASWPKTIKSTQSEAYRWLLSEEQINAVEHESFHHYARQILTSSGVQNGSHITIDFDRSYQSLTIHWIKLWRGTNASNRLDPQKIQMLQQEPDLDQSLIYGQTSALVILDDVRVGDIIEVAYTIADDHRVVDTKFAEGCLGAIVQFGRAAEDAVDLADRPASFHQKPPNRDKAHRCSQAGRYRVHLG